MMINLQVSIQNITMSGKPPYCITEQTEDCSSQQTQKTIYINKLQQTKIIDVWAHNFHHEIQKISSLTKKYNVIAFDTQFPSIQSYNENQNTLIYSQEYNKYLKLAQNVDNTSLIQLGICLSDEQGNIPLENFCWQFNFKFQGEIEQISPASAFILKKAGINFEMLKVQGISYEVFLHEFIKSGLLLNTNNKWIVFHGSFDFSYLLKLIRNEPSPKNVQDFYKSIKIYFPQKVDLKCLIQKDKMMKKMGLSRLADFIKCRRVGPEHQAGSDSLLTLQCYFKLKYDHEDVFGNIIQTKNMIYGVGYPPSPKYSDKLRSNPQTRYHDYTVNYGQIYKKQFYIPEQYYYNQNMYYEQYATNQYNSYDANVYQTMKNPNQGSIYTNKKYMNKKQ